MTRTLTASVALAALLLLVALDLTGAPLNPYQAPPVFAFGSGVAAAGGFCAALPN